MEYKLTRRRFGKLAIASSTVAGLSYFAHKSLAQTPAQTIAQTPAQTPGLAITGLRPGSLTSIDTTATNVRLAAPDTGEAAESVINSQQVRVQSLDLASNQVQNLPGQSVQAGTTAKVDNDEVITGLTYLADGTLIAAVTPVRTSRRGNRPTRLKFLGSSRSDLTISGLQRQEELKSLLGTKDGKLIGLVGKKNGTPPYRLVDVNLQTGNFNVRLNLPQNQRFSNLAQCPDGKIYTISVQDSGAVNLVQLDLGQGIPVTLSQLQFDNTPWTSGLESLLCSSAGGLLGFGAPRYVQPNSVYTIDVSSGVMAKLTDFDVSKIAIPSS